MSSGQNKTRLSTEARAHKEWSNLRIYWGDNSPANFDRAFHYPQIRLSSETCHVKKETVVNSLQSNQAKNDHPGEQSLFGWMAKTECKRDVPELRERFFCPEKADFDLPVGEQMCGLDQEDAFIVDNITESQDGVPAKGIICDRIEQYVIIEVKSEGMTETSLPKVDVWAFLQDHTIGQGPDSRAAGSEAVIDDDSKAGWFHCLIAPENKETKDAVQYVPKLDSDKGYPLHAPISVEARLDYAKRNVEEIEKKIPLTIDTRYLGQGIVRYKIRVSVVNDMTPEDNQRRWKQVYKNKFNDKPESRNIESGCWLKIWARNAEFDWPDDAQIVDSLDNKTRDAMDGADKSPWEGHPRKAKNHTWIRNRLVDALTDRPMYVGLYPTQVIEAINNLEPAFKKALEKKKSLAKNPQELDSEYSEVDLLLGSALYFATVFLLLLYVNKASDSDGDEEGASKEDRKEAIRKIFKMAQLDTVFAAYAVNGFKEGFDAAKTLGEVSKNPDKKTLFRWTKNIFEHVSRLAFGDEDEEGSEYTPPENADESTWRKNLKNSVSHELNNDGNWGATGKFNPEDKKFKVTKPKHGYGKPLPGWFSWLSMSAFLGGRAGLDLSVKGAWAPDNGEFALEFGSSKKTGGELFAGVDLKAAWTRVFDAVKESKEEAGKQELFSILDTVSYWTNLEAILKINLGVSALANLKLRYIYDSSEKPSIWNILDAKKGDGLKASRNALGGSVDFFAPLHIQLSGFTLKYDIFNMVLAKIGFEEYSFFHSGSLFGESFGKDLRSSKYFPWVRFDLDRYARVEDRIGSICIGDEISFQLAYSIKRAGMAPKDVNAWRCIKYESPLAVRFLADSDADASGGKKVELAPSSTADYDYDAVDKDSYVSRFSFAKGSKLRFSSFLPDTISKKESEYQVDFSKASDTYLHFLTSFKAKSDHGLPIYPGIRMEGMLDRGVDKGVVLKYPKLRSVDVIRPKAISSKDSKVIFNCEIEDYNDKYVAVSFVDDQWSFDEELRYKAKDKYQKWNLFEIDKGSNTVSIEIDLKNFDLEQLSEQIDRWDSSVEVKIRLSFVGASDSSIQLESTDDASKDDEEKSTMRNALDKAVDFAGDVFDSTLDKYEQKDFCFSGNENIDVSLVLEASDIKSLSL
jgi:hypothetical protein